MKRFILQPDDGPAPIASLLSSAKEEILIKQFSFRETSLQDVVIERHRAGVKIRALLNPQRTTGERDNDEVFHRFEAEGIPVRWTSPRFLVTHEKSVVVDRRWGLISTFNLSPKYLSMTRDFGVILENVAKVGQLVECFEADWTDTPWRPSLHVGLLWSNFNARRDTVEFIDSARNRLDIQNPKFADAVILDRLIAAAKRGVHVRLLCGGRHGVSDYDVYDTFSSWRILHSFGIKVHKDKCHRLHSKVMVADRKRVLIGSQNIHRKAYDDRREVGTIVVDKELVHSFVAACEKDWDCSVPFVPEDPLVAIARVDEDFPHDPDITNI